MRPGWSGVMAGKYYVDDSGQMQAIHEKDKHLEGKLLRIRSLMYCQHKYRSGVYERCYGKLAMSIPYFNVLGKIGKNEAIAGHVSATEFDAAL